MPISKYSKKLYQRLGIKSDRTKNIVRHIGFSAVFKVSSIIINFMLVPITLEYLDTGTFGVWLTLTSFISWFGFFDIGLGNGLRNKFAEAKALGNYQDAQAYVSSAYFTLGFISLIILAIFICINPFINWASLFNTEASLKGDLDVLMPLVFAFFTLQIVAKLITSIYLADQNHSIQNKVQFFTQLLSLLAILTIAKMDGRSLLLFGSIFSAIPLFVLLALNVIGFNNRYKNYKPKLSLWKKNHFSSITNLGFKFFIIQIAAMILFSTDNFIITRLFGPDEVVPYNVAFKYFSIVTMVYTIVITPYWSTFTEAYAKGDFAWIRRSVFNIQRIWLLVPVILLIMMVISDWFYKFWLGNNLVVSFSLSLSMSLFVLLITFNLIYVNFINAVGKVKLQLITGIISMIINIPLSIFLGKYLGWGTTGVILASCFSLSYAAILRPIQYIKIINKTAKGIWDQ